MKIFSHQEMLYFFEIIQRLCSDQIYIELLSKTKVKRIKDNLNEKDRNGGSCP